MVELGRLLLLDGVVAALRFHDDGSLAEAAGDLDRIDAELAAELCYANGRFTHHGTDILATLSGREGWPPRGWVMHGEHFSVCGTAEIACFVRSDGVSFNDVLRALIEA